MRIVLVSIGAIVLAAVVFFGVVILASESGEVVTLRTVDGQAESHAMSSIRSASL
jgi:beta-lactam-binding protein with PASTA domain